MHPEGRLLVLCARTTINSFVRVEVEDLVGEAIDWEEVWRLSKAHGVAPLVYRALSAICPSAVPAPIHDAFRRHLQSNPLLNSVWVKELAAILNAFTVKGIRAIPLDGLTLAQTAYGDQSLRECTSLDLVVDKASISLASQVLWSQGYHLIDSEKNGDNEAGGACHCFRKRNGVIAVNLQWAVAQRHFSFRLDRVEFWEKLKPIHLPSLGIMSLTPEDLLIVLCARGAKEAWGKLQGICDIAELVRRRPALDWSRVLFQADGWGCRGMVMLGLAMARKLYDITLPRAVLHELDENAEMSILVQHMPEQFLKNPSQGINAKCAEGLYLILKDSWWGRCKLGLALCWEQSVVIKQPLPWFRFQRPLRRLFACFQPLQRVGSRCAPSGRLRRAVIRWLERTS